MFSVVAMKLRTFFSFS